MKTRNEREQAEQFNQDVDRMIDQSSLDISDTMPADYQDMLHIAQRLSRTDFSAESHNRDNLRQHLLTREALSQKEKNKMSVITQEHRKINSAFAFAAAVILIVIMAVIWLPANTPHFGSGSNDTVESVPLQAILATPTITDSPFATGEPTVAPFTAATPESRPIIRIKNLVLM
ncbi:MAG TPA: hypothetical protein VJZ27_14825, partial [Aggregatilineales bacterium]|nr:hypothetical protein [Aggregatilineales bacterium]